MSKIDFEKELFTPRTPEEFIASLGKGDLHTHCYVCGKLFENEKDNVDSWIDHTMRLTHNKCKVVL